MSASPREVGPTLDPEDPTGPGSQLREARHRGNLSLEEVATQLRLDRRTVRALEEGDFAHLPAPTFIRGYIRSYARLLGLPPGPILEAYDFHGFTPPAILADISQRPQARSSDIPVRLATYLVAAGLVMMVVMWWHSRESAPAPPDAEQIAGEPLAGAAPDPDPAPADPFPAPAAEDRQETPPPAPAAAADSVPGPTAEPDARPAPDSAEAPAEIAAAGESPAAGSAADGEAEAQTGFSRTVPVRDAVSGAGQPQSESPDPPVPAEEPAAAPAGPAIPVLAPDSHLSIRFEKDSWVEIRDAAGIRHVFRLVNGGGSIGADGEAPFNVLLGYAPGATVIFEGETFDISRFIRGNTARFLIGTDGLSRAPRPPDEAESTESAGGDAGASTAQAGSPGED